MEEKYHNGGETERKKIGIWAYVLLVVIILLFVGFLIYNSDYNSSIISEETARCLGEKCVLYVLTGCSHCQAQKEMFKANLQYLNITNCAFGECPVGIKVPTFVCGDKIYSGIQSAEQIGGICEDAKRMV